MVYKHRTQSGKIKHYQSRGHYEKSLKGMFANQKHNPSRRHSNLVLASKIKSRKVLHKQMMNISGKQRSKFDISNKKILGEGNWSVVYDYDANRVLKTNKDQPDHFRRIVGSKITSEPFKVTFKEMLNEKRVFDLLRQDKYTLLPKNWQDSTEGNKYYSLREKGIFNLEDTKGRFEFRNWIKGSVRQSDFDKFNEEIFDVSLKHGYFNDLLQPALRKDGSLFLVDFGQFIRLTDITDDMGNVTSGNNPEKIEQNRRDGVRNTESGMKFLAEKMHLQHNFPKNLINWKVQDINEQLDRWDDRINLNEEQKQNVNRKINIIKNQALTFKDIDKIDNEIQGILLDTRVGKEKVNN